MGRESLVSVCTRDGVPERKLCEDILADALDVGVNQSITSPKMSLLRGAKEARLDWVSRGISIAVTLCECARPVWVGTGGPFVTSPCSLTSLPPMLTMSGMDLALRSFFGAELEEDAVGR